MVGICSSGLLAGRLISLAKLARVSLKKPAENNGIKVLVGHSNKAVR